MKRFIAAAAMLAFSSSISANDSSAAVGVGGLELRQNDAISMDSEDLFISRELVKVKYRFTNRSAKDIETLVSFPLPSIPWGIAPYISEQGYPDWKDLRFATKVDGKAVALTRVDRVEVNGKDVSARLKQLGWPVDYWENYEFMEKLIGLPEKQKASALREGLLRRPNDDPKAVEPAWQLVTHITRKQIFPAGKTISVEHEYMPVGGGSVGGALIAEYRKNPETRFSEYAKQYCIDKAFLAGFDKAYAAKHKGYKAKGGDYGGIPHMEHWLSYILKSGANWRGPIEDFRLVIDKEKPENLLSFCGQNVKKISPTRFEMRKTNFEPTANLDILIVEFFDPAKM
jgi:Domain of unknown function (DUF4424)